MNLRPKITGEPLTDKENGGFTAPLSPTDRVKAVLFHQKRKEIIMEYRRLPHGNDHERFSVVGIGLGGIQAASDEEIEKVVRKGIESGINYIDLCAGGRNVYAPAGRGLAGRRENVFLQIHFGAVYNEKGEYAWTRDVERIQQTFAWELQTLGIDYADFGFIHCLDEEKDFQEIIASGLFDYVSRLKQEGVIRHLGFSSHTPSTAQRMLDTGLVDMMMFSINPAYDFGHGNEYGLGTFDERTALFRRCVSDGIGISVMKAFHGGQLLTAATSPFRHPLTKIQLIQYALDRPGVLTVLPGVRGLSDLDEILRFANASEGEKDYSVLGTFQAVETAGNCVYCNHCQPCPAGIDIGLVNKFYDLANAGDPMAAAHYAQLSVHADACRHCGHCDSHCPFKVAQSGQMAKIAAYFAAVPPQNRKPEESSDSAV